MKIHLVAIILFVFASKTYAQDKSSNKSAPILKNVIKKELEKTPKSLFLIKKIKISPDVGEPQFNPEEAQLRTVINDSTLRNFKKFD